VDTKSSLVEQLRDKEYRDAFVASQIRIGLPMQCRALRESRTLTQPQLAEAAGMSQPRISEIERPGERKLNIDTLLRLASAFDVALQVRFVTFSEFVDDDDSIDFDSYHVYPFDEDIARLERIEGQVKSVIRMDQSSAFKAAQRAEGQVLEKSALQSATADVKRNVLKEQKGQRETSYSGSSIDRAS
jgi:transcriptional regulator with XRE-family HTH domain